jgi:hypothetical protein
MHCIFAYYNRNNDASIDQPEDLVFNQNMVPWGSWHDDGILTFGYILSRQALVLNPYYSALYFMLVR